MQNTTDYSIFKDVSSNREVDRGHLKSLVRAIKEKNLLPANPILVNSDMEIIDGQHRLEAAKTLSLPIFYIIAEVTRSDISKLNSNQKNWKLIDYVNFWAVEKVPNFLTFTKFYAKHDRFSLTGLLAVVNADTTRGASAVKRGDLNILDIKVAEEICDISDYLHETYGYEFVYDGSFLIALKKATQTDGFDLNTLYDKIGISPRSFVSCRNLKEYIKMIEDVYNYKLSKNQIRIK